MSETRKHSIFSLKRWKRLPWGIAFVLASLIKLIRLTQRVEIRDEAGLLETDQPWPVVFVLWHNRLVFLPSYFPYRLRSRTCALVSASRDGEYAAAWIQNFGFDVVRGSSSRGGTGALRGLKRKLEDGSSIVITLDGPRGPMYEVHPGAGALARMCNVPILPISFSAPGRWQLGSWDKTQIPRPFDKVTLRIGKPLDILKKSADTTREAIDASIRDGLLAITDDQRRGDVTPDTDRHGQTRTDTDKHGPART